MKESIGSYLSLELQKRNSFIYHPNSIYLNTGRNALEYILIIGNIKKLYIPYLYCDSILTPLKRLNIEYEFYKINEKCQPLFDFDILADKDYFLYINYLGLKDSVVYELSKKTNNLIIDNTQAFFSFAVDKIPTFYSTRKFFGVADGAILCNVENRLSLEKDKSADRMLHLLQRIENPSEVAYDFYNKVEDSFDEMPIMEMSNLTTNLLLSIDFENHKKTRNINFNFLHKNLETINRYKFNTEYENISPLAYPLWIDDAERLRAILVKNRIFTPRYWPNVINEMYKDTLEYDIAQNTIPIPVDNRYTPDVLNKVVDIIDKHIRNA